MRRSLWTIVAAALVLAACATPIQRSTSPAASAGPSTKGPSHPGEPSPTQEMQPSAGALTGQLAYVAGMDPQIFLLDIATGESRQLTHLKAEDAKLTGEGPLRPALSCGFGPSALAWSPDGTQLAFAYGGCDSVIFLVAAEGQLRRIGDGRSPTWSPDGRRLVYAANVPYMPCGAGCQQPGPPGELELRIVDVAGGGEPVPFTADGSTSLAGSPWYSPDGTVIAYSGPPQDGADPQIFGATYLVGADGSSARLVANGGYPHGWLSDGRLLIARQQDGSVHAVDLGSGDSEQVGGRQTASVSPDGTRALIWTIDPVTGAPGLRLLTNDGLPLAELPGSVGAWNPESTAFAAFAADGGLQLVSRDGDLLASIEIEVAGGWAAWRPGS